MFRNKNLFVPAMLIFAGFLGASSVNAQVARCYTLASLQGNYAIVTTYGANVALALGTRTYDGNGNMTGTFTINEPTLADRQMGLRTIVTGTQVELTLMNCNGTGQINRVLTQSNGTVTTSLDDFVITGAAVLGGQLIATSATDAQEAPSAIVSGGLFVVQLILRLPASLQLGVSR